MPLQARHLRSGKVDLLQVFQVLQLNGFLLILLDSPLSRGHKAYGRALFVRLDDPGYFVEVSARRGVDFLEAGAFDDGAGYQLSGAEPMAVDEAAFLGGY